MTKHHEKAIAHLGLKTSSEAIYTAATYKRFEEDIVFLKRQANDATEESTRKRYARIIILLTAPYLESVSNLMFGELIDKELDEVDNRADLHKPIRRFRAIHHVLLNKELKLDTNGIQDIFHIRNNITLHPAGREVVKVAGEGLGRLDKRIAYKKFKSFPFVYSHFTLSEADEILREVYQFLTEFLRLIKDKISKKQFDSWYPKELTEC
ncbi:MAG: hypothetical protein WBE46_06735 [Dehalococcoidia bacterium]